MIVGKVNNSSYNSSFGSMKRVSDLSLIPPPKLVDSTLHPGRKKILFEKITGDGSMIINDTRFVRPDEDSQKNVVDFLIKQRKLFNNVEFKVWGCSDLSTFLTKAMLMSEKLGVDNYKKMFPKIQLSDIDKPVIDRAKKGIVSLVSEDMKDLTSLGLPWQKYFQPIKKEDIPSYFLEGENFAYVDHKAETINPFIPHQISAELTQNLNIATSDIRQDLANISSHKSNTLRIFEFANAWHFLPAHHQIDLASDFSKKMKKNDILIIGDSECYFQIPNALKMLGFENVENLKTVFYKKVNLKPKELIKATEYLHDNIENVLKVI